MLIYRATQIEDKFTLLPALTQHLKMLNFDAPMIIRQLATILTMATFKIIMKPVKQSEFEGPYAISDELLAKCTRKSGTRRRKQAKEKENKLKNANKLTMSSKQLLENITHSRPNSRHFMLSSKTKELLHSKSKDMLQLTKSNVIPSETSAQRLKRIGHVISNAGIIFGQHLDKIIETRLEQQKQQRRSMIARKAAGKWRASLSGRATMPVISSSQHNSRGNTKRLVSII